MNSGRKRGRKKRSKTDFGRQTRKQKADRIARKKRKLLLAMQQALGGPEENEAESTGSLTPIKKYQKSSTPKVTFMSIESNRARVLEHLADFPALAKTAMLSHTL